MKSKLFAILGCCVLLVLSPFFSPLSYIPSKKQKLANRVRSSAAKKIETQKHLQLIGTGAQMLDEIELLGLSFQGFEGITLEEARELIVYSVETFLDEINSNEAIRPYLKNYPFTADNIELRIWLYKSDYSEVDAPNISFVVNRGGLVEYYPGFPEYNIRNPILTEPYNKAVQITTILSNEPAHTSNTTSG